MSHSEINPSNFQFDDAAFKKILYQFDFFDNFLVFKTKSCPKIFMKPHIDKKLNATSMLWHVVVYHAF